ncbi:MAG: isoprenylcysteine carboxylmethyltransferase family protein [Terriglobales bacterium]
MNLILWDTKDVCDFLMLRSSFVLAVQLLPCVALVLLGWGFRDLPAFFLNSARCGLMALVLTGAVAAVLLGLDLHPLRRGSTPVGTESAQLTILLLLSFSLLWFLPFADHRRILTFKEDYLRWVGLAFCCFGLGVRVLALKALGRHFSAYVTLQPNHQLVRHGIYAWIRHPLYLSLLSLPTGIALVFDSFLALPILLLAAMFVLDRIRKEEHLLADHFGAKFNDYKRRTRKLIPFVL